MTAHTAAVARLEIALAGLGEAFHTADRRASDAKVTEYEQADLAEAITKMTQADTAYRAALGAIGNTSRTTLMDYLR